MIDVLFWWTGLVVWMLIVVYVVPLIPAFVGVTLFTITYRPAMWIDDRYFDGTDDVEAAQEDGRWYYYAAHNLFVVSRWLEAAIDTYLAYLEPFHRRLPLI